MSATADISRYRDYFKDLGRGERVEVLAIPSSGQQTIYQRRVSYLEQVPELLGISSELLSLKYCSGPSPVVADADIKPEVHRLIHDLVLHIHKNEPDIEKSILVFLPTYYALEQQWFLLKPFSSSFKVHIVHSSIDIEHALTAMKIWKSCRKYAEYTDCYYSGDDQSTALTGRKEMVFMANLCAFQFWQRVYKDKLCLDRLKQLLQFDEMKAALVLVPEEEWCSFHNLVQPSLNHVAEIYEDILNSVHRFRPKFLATADHLPLYYEPYEFQHTCLLTCQLSGNTDTMAVDDEHSELPNETRKCNSVPFVPSSYFLSHEVAENLATIIKEVRVQYTEDISGNEHKYVNGDGPPAPWEPSLCKFFVKGLCNRGKQCSYSHSLQAKRSVCKFFLSLKGCRNGDKCEFSHDVGPSTSSSSRPSLCLPEDEIVDAKSLLGLFPTSYDGCILLLDDTDFHFSSHLSRNYNPSKIISTTVLSAGCPLDASLSGVRILWGLSHPSQTIISKAEDNPIPWSEVKCVLWFPKFDSDSENLEEQKSLLQTFFKYLAILILADELHEVQVILTMNNIRFSRLQVEKLGRESFVFLRESFSFDESSFGKLFDTVTLKKPMLVSKPISYVFDLNLPTDIEFANFAT